MAMPKLRCTRIDGAKVHLVRSDGGVPPFDFELDFTGDERGDLRRFTVGSEYPFEEIMAVMGAAEN